MAINLCDIAVISLSQRGRTIGFVLVLTAMAAAAVSFGFVRTSINNIHLIWEQNLQWPSAQLENEYLRFRESLVRFGSPDFDVDPQDVNKRFDILWSRINALLEGTVKDHLEQFPHALETVLDLQKTMVEQEPKVISLQEGQSNEVISILKVFEQHRLDLFEFNQGIMRGQIAYSVNSRNVLNFNSTLLTLLGMGAIIVSFLLVVFFALETRRQRAIAEENRELLAVAESAVRTKAAFLGMMSHDLRTPMNGVLGMIALAKRQGANKDQLKILGHAEDSSTQMSELLIDILDFAALEDVPVSGRAGSFEVEILRQKIQNSLEISTRLDAVSYDLTVDVECPEALKGDARRIRQIVVHLAQFLGRNSAQKEVAINIFFRDGFLKIEFSFYFDKQVDTWRPETILGAISVQETAFTNDVLGPAISRGFTENLGGEILLQLPTDMTETARAELVIPLEVYVPEDVVVRIETRTAAMTALCYSAIKFKHVRFFKEGMMTPVDTVVVETGGSYEADTCKSLRRLYPQAAFVALGTPTDPSLFDDQITLPIDVTALREAAFLSKPVL